MVSAVIKWTEGKFVPYYLNIVSCLLCKNTCCSNKQSWAKFMFLCERETVFI